MSVLVLSDEPLEQFIVGCAFRFLPEFLLSESFSRMKIPLMLLFQGWISRLQIHLAVLLLGYCVVSLGTC